MIFTFKIIKVGTSFALPLCFFRLFLVSAPESDTRDLLSELEVMKTLKPHRHVITLLGCITETGKTNV